MVTKILLLMIWSLIFNSSETFRLKVTKMYCNSTDKDFATFETCRVKAVSRYVQYFSLYIKFHQLPLNEAEIRYHIVKRANGYKPFLYDFTLICDFIKHLNPLTNILWTWVKEKSNLNHSCPFTEDFEIKSLENRYLEEKLQVLPIPDGDYAMFIYSAQVKNESTQVYVTDSCLEKPFRCPHPKIQFFLYTRRTQEEPEFIDVLDDNALYYTHFNPRHPTKIIIHGFGGGRNLSPSPDIRQAYFTIGDYNIIIVDYGSAVREPCLSQMDWSPRFGGLCISQLVKYLARHPRGVQPDDIHFIGYSVGAHIAGLVANYLQPNEGKLGRITALDPTIFFYAGTNNSRDLDSSDAHFVDVLHTGAGILGQWHNSGHADFYVNGGTRQPACVGSATLFQTLACDHTKVTPYFIESITTQKGFYAGPCPNLFTYLIGWCEPKDSEYVLMGEHVSHKARGTYYVTTNAKPPFARGFPGKGRSARTGEYQGVRRRRHTPAF